MPPKKRHVKPVNDGFFYLYSGDTEHELPRDIFHHIIGYILPYPYYLTLSTVSKQWQNEFTTTINPSVSVMDLVNRFTVTKGTQYKPIYYRLDNNSIKYVIASTKSDYKRLNSTFPNVNTVRMDYQQRENRWEDLDLFANIETLEIIRNPYTEPSDIEIALFYDEVPRTLTSLILVNFSIKRSNIFNEIQALHGDEDAIVTISKVSFVDCTCKNEEEIIKIGQQLYGSNFWLNTIDIKQQNDFDRYIHKMRREGFDPDFIMAEGKLNSMSNSIVTKNYMLFNYLWTELMKQVHDTSKKLDISLPTVKDIAEAMGTTEGNTFAKHVLDTITDPNAPQRVRSDLNTVFQMRLPHSSATVNTTLLGYALAVNDFTLVDFLKEKGSSVLVPGTLNPIVMVMMIISAGTQSSHIDRICDMFPELLTVGDEKGNIKLDDANELVHKFNPLLLVQQHSPLSYVQSLHQRGIPLLQKGANGETCLHVACRNALYEIVQYILDESPKESKEIAAECIESLFNEDSHATRWHDVTAHSNVLKTFANTFGFDFLKELRYGKNKESVLHLVVRKWHNVRIDDLINDLIDIIGFQPDITDEQGNTPLHFPPIQFLSFTSHNTFMQLIAKGCSPTIQNKNGDTFLETAILYYPNLVRDMKDRNIVDLDTVRMRKNRNVYHVMFNAMTLHMQTFDHNPMFLEADDDGISPLMLLLENQNTTNRKVFVNSNYEFLKHYTKLSISSSDTVTPLQYLIRKGLYSTPLYALYLEISPEQVLKRDEKSPGNPTTLHQLVTGASSRVLEAFFKVVSSLGKDNLSSMINAKTEDTDATPLVIAAQHGNIEALDTLLKHGASIQQCQVNLAQSAFDNRQYLCALHMLCSEQFKQVKSTVDMMAKSLKMFLIFNEKKQDALIVKGLERVLQDNKQDRNQFFELLCRVTNTEMENHEFVRQCSIFQLLCLHRKKVIIEWILDTFTDLLAIEVSPFDVHPLDIITENEPLFDNNCFHFACNDGEIASLTTEEFIEDAKPNQTATKSLLTKLMAHNRVKQKDLLNQFNKIGDTPTHLSCKANLQSVWADMIANGANMNLPNKKDKLPVELISETSKTAFTKCISGKTKPTKVAAQKKAPVKKAAPKRKRKDEDEFSGEEDASEQVQEPPRIRRKK